MFYFLYVGTIEIILRRDDSLTLLLKKFESKEAGDSSFLEHIHELISKLLLELHWNKLNVLTFSLCILEDECEVSYDELFADTTIEVGKTLSKTERDRKNLSEEKVRDKTPFLFFFILVSWI